jgi:transcriptional regulator with XRE-family HTH domain
MDTISVRQDVLNSLKVDPEYRHAWNLENVYTGLCFQIRALREQRDWSQAALGKSARMAQERISILEDPNADTKPTLSTLLRIADAFDVGLDVRFVSYRTVLDRSTNTDMKQLEVQSFENELPELEREVCGTTKRRARRKVRSAGSVVVISHAMRRRKRLREGEAKRKPPAAEYGEAMPMQRASGSGPTALDFSLMENGNNNAGRYNPPPAGSIYIRSGNNAYGK